MHNLLKVLLLTTVLVATDSYAFPWSSDGSLGYGYNKGDIVGGKEVVSINKPWFGEAQVQFKDGTTYPLSTVESWKNVSSVRVSDAVGSDIPTVEATTGIQPLNNITINNGAASLDGNIPTGAIAGSNAGATAGANAGATAGANAGASAGANAGATAGVNASAGVNPSQILTAQQIDALPARTDLIQAGLQSQNAQLIAADGNNFTVKFTDTGEVLTLTNTEMDQFIPAGQSFKIDASSYNDGNGNFINLREDGYAVTSFKDGQNVTDLYDSAGNSRTFLHIEKEGIVDTTSTTPNATPDTTPTTTPEVTEVEPKVDTTTTTTPIDSLPTDVKLSGDTASMNTMLEMADSYGATDAAVKMDGDGVLGITKLGEDQYGVTMKNGESLIMSGDELNKQFGSGASELAEGATGVMKDFSEWASKTASNLADELGDTAFSALKNSSNWEALKNAGPEAIQKALEDSLYDSIYDALYQKAVAKYGEEWAQQNADKLAEEARKAAAKKAAELTAFKVLTQNVVQYALVIWEAIKANEIDDATKEVKVKGADSFGDSQGTTSSGASTQVANTPMTGTTISDSANAMISLLENGKIDLSLLSMEIEKEKEAEKKESLAGVRAGSATSQAGIDTTNMKTTSTATTDSSSLTTEESKEIMKRRALLLGEWATAATQIAEGSNAISSTFYDRAAAFSMAANSAQGSLGGISTITDTDRFVLFEITRGAALSAIQLGLQGAVNLNNLDVQTTNTTTKKKTSTLPGVSIRTGETQ